jgi:hypothetical protein
MCKPVGPKTLTGACACALARSRALAHALACARFLSLSLSLKDRDITGARTLKSLCNVFIMCALSAALLLTRRYLRLARVALVLVLGAGCGGAQMDMLVGPITVAPGWTAQERLAVERGIAAWQMGLYGVDGPCDGSKPCLEVSDSPAPDVGAFAVGTTFPSTRTSVIYRARIYGLGRPDWIQQTVTHELGHQLARSSLHLPSGNVMAADVSQAAPVPTDLDRAYVWGL